MLSHLFDVYVQSDVVCRAFAAGMGLPNGELDVPIQRTDTDSDLMESVLARKILTSALAKNQACTFTAEIKAPSFVSILQEGGKVRLENFIAEDGFAFTKIEKIKAKGQATEICVRNRAGDFLHAFGGWVKVDEILDLSYLSVMAERLPEQEMENSLFTMRETSYAGRRCYEITMRTSADYQKLCAQNPILPLQRFIDKDLSGPSFLRRPMTRTFLIDQEKGFILSRRHFNLKGQLLYSRVVTNIQFDTRFNEDEFSVLEEILGEFRFPREAYEFLYERTALQRQQASRRHNAHHSASFWTLSAGKYLLLTCGVLLVCAAFWLRKHRG